MKTIKKRLDNLEAAIKPAGRIYTALECEDQPGLYKLANLPELLTMAEIQARLGPNDTLIRIKYQ